MCLSLTRMLHKHRYNVQAQRLWASLRPNVIDSVFDLCIYLRRLIYVSIDLNLFIFFSL